METWERLIQTSDSLWFSSNLLTANGVVAQMGLEDKASSVPVDQAKATSSREKGKVDADKKGLPVLKRVKVRKNTVLEDKEAEKRRALERLEIKGFLDLGFGLEEIGLEKRVLATVRGLRNGRDGEVGETSKSSSLGDEKTPLSNGMAKEHLRSWAYAVACSLK